MRSLSDLWNKLLGLVENRLALFSVELREERDFILQAMLLVLAATTLFCARRRK